MEQKKIKKENLESNLENLANLEFYSIVLYFRIEVPFNNQDFRVVPLASRRLFIIYRLCVCAYV